MRIKKLHKKLNDNSFKVKDITYQVTGKVHLNYLPSNG